MDRYCGLCIDLFFYVQIYGLQYEEGLDDL